jgi:Fusaric acid resistance protein-like
MSALPSIAALRALGTLGGAALGLLLGPLGAQQPVDDRAIARHALQGAPVVALLSIVMCQVHLAAFAQALVTTLAVLVVPLEAGAADTEARVTQRMVQRIAGCLAAGVLAFALLPLLAGHSLACQVALCAGTWLGAYLQRGPASVRYMATQFSAAFLMVFVQDSGWNLEAGAAFERLAGILAGVVALALVMQAWKHLRSLR